MYLILLFLCIPLISGMEHLKQPKTLFVKSTGRYADMRIPNSWLIEQSEMFRKLTSHRDIRRAWLLPSKNYKQLQNILPYLILHRCNKYIELQNRLEQESEKSFKKLCTGLDYFGFFDLLNLCEKALAQYFEQHISDFLQDQYFNKTLARRGINKHQANRIAKHIDLRYAPCIIEPQTTQYTPENFCSIRSSYWPDGTKILVQTYKSGQKDIREIFFPEETIRDLKAHKNVIIIANNTKKYIRYYDLTQSSIKDTSNTTDARNYLVKYTLHVTSAPEQLCCDFINNIMAIVFEDTTIKIYTLAGGDELYSLENNIKFPYLSFNKQGTALCISNHENLILWDLIEKKTFFAEKTSCSHPSFSYAGDRMCYVAQDGFAILNIFNHAKINTPFNDYIDKLQWSADDFYIICSHGNDLKISIFVSSTCFYLRRLENQYEYVDFLTPSILFNYPQSLAINLIPRENLTLEQALLVLAFIQCKIDSSNSLNCIIKKALFQERNDTLFEHFKNLPHDLRKGILEKYL